MTDLLSGGAPLRDQESGGFNFKSVNPAPMEYPNDATSYTNQLRNTQMFNEYPVAIVRTSDGGAHSVTTHGDITTLSGPTYRRAGIKTSLDVPNNPHRVIVGATVDDEDNIHMISKDGSTHVVG